MLYKTKDWKVTGMDKRVGLHNLDIDFVGAFEHEYRWMVDFSRIIMIHTSKQFGTKTHLENLITIVKLMYGKH